jgi:hypothetical protein
MKKTYKTKSGQTIRILEYKNFVETINSPERVEKIMHGLSEDFKNYNSRIAINYSDEGYALFEVIQNLPRFLMLYFTGTAC